ncbi:MAG: CBS domain-containing protein [Gemmatimonadota bacterium]
MDSPASISGLLPPGRIIVGLKARSYKDAVGRLLDRLDEAGLVGDRAAIDELVDAEVLRGEIPTLGPRSLLAHYRHDSAEELAVAVGTSAAPFKFAPATAPDAVFLILIVTPRTAVRYYLKTLAGLSHLLSDAAVADALSAASSPEEFAAIVAEQGVLIRPELLVSDLMSRDFQTVSPETLLSEALHLMVRHRRRGMPVVSDNGEVLGIVSERELLEHFLPQVLSPAAQGERSKIQDVEVRDVMQRSVMCLAEDELITDVLGTMLSEGVAQFPVVKEGKLVGFLSRTDLIHKLLEPSVHNSI